MNLGNYLHEPFARIIPMHLTIYRGYFIVSKENQFLLLILFLIIKEFLMCNPHTTTRKNLTPTKKQNVKKKNNKILCIKEFM